MPQSAQYAFAQANGVTLATLRELDHCFGYRICLGVFVTLQAEGLAYFGHNARHHSQRFRLERFISEQTVDSHARGPSTTPIFKIVSSSPASPKLCEAGGLCQARHLMPQQLSLFLIRSRCHIMHETSMRTLH